MEGHGGGGCCCSISEIVQPPLHFSYLTHPTLPSSSSSPLFLHLLLPHLIKMFRMMRAGVVGVQKMHKVEEKARVYKCLDKKCLDKEGWKCRSTLIKHWKEDHGSGNSRSIYCHYCGNLKGYENSCAFLAAHQPPCAAKIEPKITRAYALAMFNMFRMIRAGVVLQKSVQKVSLSISL